MSGTAAPEYGALLPGSLWLGSDVDGSSGGRIRRTARDWVVDVLIVVLSLVSVPLLTFDAINHHTPTGLWVADAVVGVVAAVGMWYRRRWPVGVALALAPVSCFSVTAVLPIVVALFTVAVHRRFAIAMAIAALQTATAFVSPVVRPEFGESYAIDAGLGVVITAAVLAWGMFVRARRELVLSLRERAQRAESEQQLRVAQARQMERSRIAREMHDVLAHRISLLSLHAGALEVRPDATPEEVARAAGIIRGSAHQALEDLREVIGVLRENGHEEAPDRPQPTIADLPALVDESRGAGMRVRLDERVDDLAAVPASVGRSAYRIVQEGLTNARKHASGSTVDVAVTGGPGTGLTVEVRNPWPVGASAAAPIPGAGLGIVGLAERTSLAGGRLEHGRTPSGDFRLWAWLPWPA